MTDEELTAEAIDAYHSKGTAVWSGDLVNKGSFLTQVKLFTFFDGEELPFEIEGSLNIKTRMPFNKARMILPRPMFDPAFPMISKVEPLRYKNLAYVYTEIRGVNDVSNNTGKTAEFLLMHEWVAVVQTSKESKMYLFPTCSLTHELGITHKNHPLMLHGLFVKFLVNKGTQTPQGYTVEQLYKAGLTRLDKQVTRDKVTVYQTKSEKPEDKRMLNGLEKGDVEATTGTSDVKPITSQSLDSAKATTSNAATSVIKRNDTSDIVGSTTSDTVLLPTANSTTVPCTVGASTTMLPSNSSATSITVGNSATPIVTSDSTSTVNVTKAATSVCDLQSNSTPNEKGGTAREVGVIKSTEPRIGQKRSATDTSGASAPKRTREVLRNNLQQLLEGKGSVSEDETAKTPSQSTNITDVQLDNITVSDEVFQHLESAMSMISNRELHSIIKPLQTASGGSPAKSQPATTASGDLGVTVKLEDDGLTSSAATVAPTTAAAVLTEDKTSTAQANMQPQFNVPTVVYDKPCKRPKSILKGGTKIEQLDDTSVAMEDSPTTPASTKVPRKIGLAEYKKRHKERRDSEDVVDELSTTNLATEVVAESTSKDCKKSVDLPSPSPTDHLMIVEEAIESSIDGTATSKANSDVSVSFKEEKKESPSKSESLPVILSKGQSISKPVSIKVPHPVSMLPSSSGAIIPHKYTDLSLPHYYPNPPFRHDWTTNYPVFGGLSRPYLMPHPPTAPLPSTILTTAMIPNVPPPPPPPVVFDPLAPVSQKADEEMAMVGDLTEMFTKNLQNKLKHVIHSDESSSRESSPKPRKSRSLSRSLSPPPRSSRRGRSPRRSRRSNSRSQSLDSCRGSDREQTRSRSKSPRFHKSHRSRRYRSSSRESSVEDRRHSRSSKRNRNDKRRDHKPTVVSKTISTQTEENTYKSGDTKRLSEKESQTDRLLFVHSRGSQTYPMFENHKAVQVDFAGACFNFYADLAQYLETYPLDMFHFDDILNNSINYFEQEISKVFPCNQTLSSKKVKEVLEFGYMKELNSQLKNLMKEGQSVNPYMVDRPGTPLLDDNQPVVNLTSTIPGENDGNGQPIDEESSGLSNSEILSDSEGSIDSLPDVNLKEMLLSQYSNNGKATQEQTSSTETSHVTPTKNRPEESPVKQSNTDYSCKQSSKLDDKNKNKVTNEAENTSKLVIKEETIDLDKSFVPDNDKLVDSTHCDRMSPSLPSTHYTISDHTYSKNGSHPSGTQLKVSSVSKDGAFLTTTEHSKSSCTGQKKVSPKVSSGNEFIYQNIRRAFEEYPSLTACPTGGDDHFSDSIESDHDTIDMEISLTDSQNEEESLGNVSTEERVDESKSELSKSSKSSTGEDKNKGTVTITDSKPKGVGQKTTKDLHHYTYHTHYQAQPFKYRQQQRPQLYYGAPVRPETYIPWDWRRSYAWGPPRY